MYNWLFFCKKTGLRAAVPFIALILFLQGLELVLTQQIFFV